MSLHLDMSPPSFAGAQPARIPRSGDYCPSCQAAGISHCGDPSRRGERTGCGERIPYKAALSSSPLIVSGETE